MTGGLMNIISFGINDLYLTGTPQVTFFKIIYRRYTNFSKESVEFTIGNLNFNDEISIPIPRVGDLINNIYLKFVIPKISLRKTDLATDLTSEQLTFLKTPYTYPNMYNTKQVAISDIASKYSIINKFMEINMNGYRVASNIKNIKNQTVQNYINSILDVLTYPSSLHQEYFDSLNLSLEIEHTLFNSNEYNIILDPNLSSLRETIYLLITKPIDDGKKTYDDFSIQYVYNILTKTVDICNKTKSYFFNKVKEAYVEKLDEISLNVKFAWIKNLGHAMIDWIDVYIGGERMDRRTGDFMNVWRELTGNEQEMLYNKMIGNVLELITFDKNPKPEYTIIIPLQFWFCKYAGLSFPHISLQYEPINLILKLNEFNQCAYVEKLHMQNGKTVQEILQINELTLNDIWNNNGFSITTSILIDYVYLDTLERRRFAKSGLEYMIDIVDEMKINNLISSDQDIKLNFMGCSRELIWRANKNSYIQDNSNLIKMPFNYSYTPQGVGNPINDSVLILNSYDRFEMLSQNYFNYIQPYQSHTRTPSDGVNMYSFCLYPQEYQTCGTLNFSRFINPRLTFKINKKMFKYNLSDVNPNIEPNTILDIEHTTTVNIIIYSIRTTIIRFIGGMCGFAFK